MTSVVVPQSAPASSLGYRTFLTIAGDRSTVPRLVDEQIHSWLSDKGWAGDLLDTGREVRLSPEATGVRTDVLGADGSRTTRLRTEQIGGWITQLTVHVPGSPHRDAWLWMDVLSPGGQRPGPPKLIRNLVSVLDARDGAFGMPAGPVTVDVSGVDDLVARLTDPGRRTIAFVAGSKTGVPFDGWSDHVDKIVKNNHGLASTHILTPAATTLFRERVGAHHAVAPFTVRTFLPRVDIAEPDDGVRHRYLTMQRIIEARTGVLANVLKGRAAAYSLALSLPKETIRVDRLLRGRDTAVLLDELTVSAGAAGPDVAVMPLDDPPASDVVAPVVDMPPVADPEPSGAHGARETAEVEPATSAVLAVLQEAAKNLLGSDSLDLDAVRRLVELSALGRRVAQARDSIERRMTELEDQLVTAEVGILDKDELLQQASLDQSIAEIELVRSEDLVRRLRLRIASSAIAADAWIDQPLSDEELAPQDFTELLERMKDLAGVRFTGDAETSRKLDEHGVASWAPKTWAALLAVQDYTRCRLNQTWSGDLESYLKATPPGCATFSTNKFARDETGDLKQNIKFRQPRTLPVPKTVDPAGVVFMGAHFKIAQWGMVSPRMHLHDDVLGTGIVYVGYIGPHLLSKKTN